MMNSVWTIRILGFVDEVRSTRVHDIFRHFSWTIFTSKHTEPELRFQIKLLNYAKSTTSQIVQYKHMKYKGEIRIFIFGT